MKRFFVVATALSVVGLASQASADIIGTTTTAEVGGIDQIIAAGPSGSAHDDAAFINAVLGLSFSNEEIDDLKQESLSWYAVSDGVPNQYAINLPDDGGWFLIKTTAVSHLIPE